MFEKSLRELEVGKWYICRDRMLFKPLGRPVSTGGVLYNIELMVIEFNFVSSQADHLNFLSIEAGSEWKIMETYNDDGSLKKGYGRQLYSQGDFIKFDVVDIREATSSDLRVAFMTCFSVDLDNMEMI